MARKQPAPPACAHCSVPAVLVSGMDVYPHRPDLGLLSFWRCVPCDATVGCHKGTRRALGRPANAELGKARVTLHEQMVDPLWKTAVESVGYTPEDPRAIAIIRNTARARVYEYLGWRLGLDRDECHVAQFDLVQCRRAWVALRGITYPEIRDWAKARKAKAAA